MKLAMSADKKLQRFWAEFIELYKSLPVLWNVKCPEYSNRVMKSAAYDELVTKLREQFPEGNKDVVTRKINTFRSNYKRDLKKVKESLKSGAGAHDVFQSSLWYFDLLSFLENQKECQPGRNTLYCMDDEEETIQPPKKKKTGNATDENTLIKLECGHQQTQNHDSSALSRSWETQYQEMSARQKILSRKLISDILYYGCLGQLQENHAVELQQMMSRPTSSYSNATTTDSPDLVLVASEVKKKTHCK